MLDNEFIRKTTHNYQSIDRRYLLRIQRSYSDKDMRTLGILVVLLAVLPDGFPTRLDELKLGELNWYITGKISEIIREEVKGLSQNVTDEKLDCESQIKIVSDTCFECNRLIGEQQKTVGKILEKTPETNKTKTSIKPNIEWKEIRARIEKKAGKVRRKLTDLFKRVSKIRFPKVKLPEVNLPSIDISNFQFPKIDFSKIQIPKIQIPSVDLSKFQIPPITFPKIELGNIQIPKFTIPSIKFPKISFPSIDLGSIFRGKRSITDCNDCEQFRTATEEDIVLRVCGSQYVQDTKSRKERLDKLELLNSALESDFVYNVTFDENSMDFLGMTVNLISVDYKLSNSSVVHTYNATGERLYLIDMIRSAEILAPKLFQDFLN
uniref:Uncharacterized protein LOC111121125 isoform X2 n=1 Tax=Crassostrea virginica TaxID=6565 RepID=A0A8B8CU42_CRAVI|nr:uncharacterized protein LOC111121125 isoform X2 [Crassostrea virginica]